MKKLKLEKVSNAQITLFGLYSSEKDYRLAWLLNQDTHFNFTRAQDLEWLIPKSSHVSLHPRFIWASYDPPTGWELIKNRGSHGLLAPLKSPPDYLLVVQRKLIRFEEEQLLHSLKNLNYLPAVLPLEPDSFPELATLVL